MKKTIKALFFTLTLLSVSSLSAIEIKEGEHYDVVSAKASDKKVVYEYFNYGCPGCYKSEALVSQIKSSLPKDAALEPVPFENHAGWKIYVEAFYIAEMLGISEQAHKAVYHQVHVERKAITSKDQLKELFVKLGADPAKFDGAAKSFQLNTKVSQGRKAAMSHKVLSTPTFVVNGKYRVNARAFGSNQELIDAINQLVNM